MSTTMRPTLRPFTSLVPGFMAGSDTPRALLERCITEIEARDGDVGAFAHIDLASARSQADASTQRYVAKAPLSAIDGMPFGIKDIVETHDMPTGYGSTLFAGNRGGIDAASVYALREAGAVIVGKTVTTELAATEPGKTRNPWDLARTPGGSSSGSAAAVGSGMLCAALGTQVIGSILRPASYCGAVGYKPTVGGINRGGSVDFHSQSVHGVIAASLEDAWTAVRAITARCGGDPGFPGVRGPLVPPNATLPGTLALLETAGWTLATPDAKAQLHAALTKLRAAGVTILDRTASPLIEAIELAIVDARPISMAINTWEFRWPLNTYARHLDHSQLSAVMQQRLVEAEKMTLDDYDVLLQRRAAIRALYAQLAGSCSAAITLSAPDAAPVGIGHTGEPAFVVPGSSLGVPAVSLPVLSTGGLPLGLQLLGYHDRDADLFGVAAAVNAVLQ
jgi:Asp-tRNA(Asn)/Glu-tRNA(Gln) amidotransferase A subunit family amidase